MDRTFEALSTVVDEVSAGRRAALCAIVATRGSTPQPVGTIVCVDEAAKMTGTLGGGCMEADVRRRAHQLLSDGRSDLVTFDLDHDFGFDDGMICGGSMDVAICTFASGEAVAPLQEALEHLAAGQSAPIPLHVTGESGTVGCQVTVEPAPKLVIAGGGHLGRYVAEAMVRVGFRVWVVDDRAALLARNRFPPPIEPVVGDIAATLRVWPIDPATYVVIVTRGHKHDLAALAAVLDSPARYLGMIGSRRKAGVIFDDLQTQGFTDMQLGRVRTPIGLEIGAVTAQEIALSIAAELVSVRRKTANSEERMAKSE